MTGAAAIDPRGLNAAVSSFRVGSRACLSSERRGPTARDLDGRCVGTQRRFAIGLWPRRRCGAGAGGLQRDPGIRASRADTSRRSSRTIRARAGNIASLTDVIQRNPNDSVAYNTRGIAYAKIGRYQNAIDDFTKAVQLDPKFAAAYTNRALAYRQMRQGRPGARRFQPGDRRQSQRRPPISAAAICCARRAISPRRSPISTRRSRLNPEGAQAFHARGLIYQRQGNHVQAITDFNNAIDRDPFAGAPYQARGQSLLATGKYDAAIEDFNAALNVDANNADAWTGLGEAYEKENNKPKAMESYSRAIAVDPSDQTARDGLSRLR